MNYRLVGDGHIQAVSTSLLCRHSKAEIRCAWASTIGSLVATRQADKSNVHHGGSVAFSVWASVGKIRNECLTLTTNVLR